jgi:hypothetical protein
VHGRPPGGGLFRTPFRLNPQGGLAGAGLGIVLPTDVLTYRAMWNQYVLDTVSAGQYCGGLMQQVASANPSNSQSTLLAQLGSTTVTAANDLLSKWNGYNNLSSEAIVVNASVILQNEQQVVLDAGRQRQSMLADRGGSGGPISCGPVLVYQDSSGNIITAAIAPDPNTQAQVVAGIEGLGILGSGLLQILVDSTTSGLQTAGSAAQWIAQQGKTLIETTTSYLPWVLGSVAVIGAAGVALVYAPEIKGALATRKSVKRKAVA